MTSSNQEEFHDLHRSTWRSVALPIAAGLVVAFITIKSVPPSPSTSISSDHNEGLNSVRQLKICKNNKTPYTIEIQTDNFGGDISWSLSKMSPNGTETPLKNSNQAYGNNEKYKRQLCLSDGDYLFEVEDIYGDGMCCAFGQGYAAVFEKGKEVLRVKRFKDMASNVFRVGYNPLPEMTERDKVWEDVHNEYRKRFHEENGKKYVPVSVDESRYSFTTFDENHSH